MGSRRINYISEPSTQVSHIRLDMTDYVVASAYTRFSHENDQKATVAGPFVVISAGD